MTIEPFQFDSDGPPLDSDLAELDRDLARIAGTIPVPPGLAERLHAVSWPVLAGESESGEPDPGPLMLPERGRSAWWLFGSIAAGLLLALGLAIRFSPQIQRPAEDQYLVELIDEVENAQREARRHLDWARVPLDSEWYADAALVRGQLAEIETMLAFGDASGLADRTDAWSEFDRSLDLIATRMEGF